MRSPAPEKEHRPREPEGRLSERVAGDAGVPGPRTDRTRSPDLRKTRRVVKIKSRKTQRVLVVQTDLIKEADHSSTAPSNPGRGTSCARWKTSCATWRNSSALREATSQHRVRYRFSSPFLILDDGVLTPTGREEACPVFLRISAALASMESASTLRSVRRSSWARTSIGLRRAALL